jgi:hypothetical protein
MIQKRHPRRQRNQMNQNDSEAAAVATHNQIDSEAAAVATHNQIDSEAAAVATHNQMNQNDSEAAAVATRTMNCWSTLQNTPKAFANSSPGFEEREPWDPIKTKP